MELKYLHKQKAHKIYVCIFWTVFAESLLVNASEEQVFEPKLMPSVSEVVHFVNDSYIISCEAKPARVRWFDPSNEWIDPKNRSRIHVEEQNSRAVLIFTSISPEDKGNWTCQAENNPNRIGFYMIVYKPIKFVDPQNVQSVKENEDAVIKCMVIGDPEPTISWFYNGQPINPDGKKYRSLADGLLIENVTKDDSGEYTCKAFQISPVLSNVEEKTIRLNIMHKPIPPVRWESADVQYGYINGYVNIKCEAEGEPAPTFRWYRNNKQLDPEHYPISNEEHMSILQLYLSEQDQFGEYVCEANNSLGTLKRNIMLNNGTKPSPPPILQLRGVNSNTFDLDVGAKEPDTPDLMDINGYRFEIISQEEYRNNSGKWTNARVVIKNFTDGITYLINDLSPNTTYLIRVASRNVAGLSDWMGPKEFQTKAKVGFGHTSAATASQSASHNVVMINVIHLLIFYLAYEIVKPSQWN